MGGRDGQVAFYVLIGLVILILVILGLYLTHLKKASTQTSSNQQLLKNDPQLAAERARMQQRVDNCLGQTVKEVTTEMAIEGVPVTTLKEAEPLLADEISREFPSCFFNFNTREKLLITDNENPRINVQITENKVTATATYAVKGEFEDLTYTLSDYSATAETTLGQTILRDAEISRQIEAAMSGQDASGIVDKEGFIDPYALVDQNILLDVITYDDGSCLIIFYDYNVPDGEPPLTGQREYQKCVPV